MFSCITFGKYSMYADFYAQHLSQDLTGQISKTWGEDDPNADPQDPYPPRLPTYSRVPVEARGLGNLRGKDSGTAEMYRNVYQMLDFLRIKTMLRINQSYRISNIQDASGRLAWVEQDGITPTLFDVIGVTPSFDPFAQFIEYEAFCNRAQAQTFYTGNYEETTR
jgi:hypothetical protein